MKLVIVDHELLCLVPSDYDDEVSFNLTVPLVRLRDLPSFLAGRALSSWNSLLEHPNRKVSAPDHSGPLQIKEVPLKSLSSKEQNAPRVGNGSFLLPSGDMVQIWTRNANHVMTRRDACLLVSNAGGYIMSDFLSIGGYQQVLFLPKLTIESSQSNFKQVLIHVLSQSVFCDGVSINLPKDVTVDKTRSPIRGESCPNICLRDVTASIVSTSVPTVAANEPPVRRKHEPISDGPGWADTMARALELQLEYERRTREAARENLELEQHLLEQNRLALQQLVHPEGAKVEAVRMRYRVLPYSTTRSVSFWMEMDLQATEASVQNLFLSCNALPTTTMNVSLTFRTHSGTAPSLQPGECVTISTSVQSNDIVLANDESDDWALRLSIDAHWTMGQARERRASRVATLQLSLESLLFFQEDMECIELSTDAVKSSAIYECRKPHYIRVDVGRCAERCDWKEWAASLNNLLDGKGHCIYVCPTDNSGTISLAMLAFTDQDCAGTSFPRRVDVPLLPAANETKIRFLFLVYRTGQSYKTAPTFFGNGS